MNGSDLRISNCNYDASVLLKRVRGLLARDDQLLGGAVQRSALMRLPGPNAQHVMTQIEVLPKFGDSRHEFSRPRSRECLNLTHDTLPLRFTGHGLSAFCP